MFFSFFCEYWPLLLIGGVWLFVTYMAARCAFKKGYEAALYDTYNGKHRLIFGLLK